MTKTKLTRDLDEAMLGGVLSGIAKQYDWDPTLLRLVAALIAVATGIIPAVILYIVAWVLIPRADAIDAPPASAAPEATEDRPAAEASSPSSAVADEIASALRDAADRLGEAATIAGDAARQAANEIGEVARRPRGAAAEDAPATTETSDPATASTAGETTEAGEADATPADDDERR